MIARQIQSFDELQLSEFGIRAPPSGDSYRGIIDVCVCPGLAFSETGDRIGGGLGFYDRYLAHQPPRVAIGLVLERMVKPWLPVDSHDRRMDYVVTENRVIHVDRASR
jgi:5-formyltetrahydrofolate cyclo-ligase